MTIGHRLDNASLWRVDIAPWALTIMNCGGAVILPQEPYKSHDEALLPVRSITLWAYTDLSDPRWQLGSKYLRLRTDAARTASQKIGIANHQGWAGYLRNGTLFVKRVDWKDGATYPDGGVNIETYTAGNFIELETLGPLVSVASACRGHARGALVPLQGRGGCARRCGTREESGAARRIDQDRAFPRPF